MNIDRSTPRLQWGPLGCTSDPNLCRGPSLCEVWIPIKGEEDGHGRSDPSWLRPSQGPVGQPGQPEQPHLLSLQTLGESSRRRGELPS